MRLLKAIILCFVICPMYGWWWGQITESWWGLIPSAIGGFFIGNLIANVYAKKSKME